MPRKKDSSLYPTQVAFMLIFLSLALYLFFSLWPIMYSVFIAFTDANNINIASEPRVRELLAQKAALTSYLTSNKDTILKQVYQADRYLGDATSLLTEMRNLILTSNPQNFSLGRLSSLRRRVDEALTYASSIVRSNTTFLYYYRNLGNTLYRAVSLIEGGVWSDLDRILGFKLVVSDNDIKQLRETVVPEIDQALSVLRECQALLREIERDYNLFVTSATAGLDEEIDRISMHFIGLKNFQTLFTDSRFPYSIYKTILFVFTSVPLKVTVGVLLAFLLSSPMIYGRRVMRAALLVPWAIPILLSVTTWRMMMAPGIGPIASYLSSMGIDFSIYTREWDAFLAYNIVEMWLAYPFIMTVTMAAISSIPRELIESAMVDGASAWQRFKDVMLPLTSRPILFASILTAGASLQAFMVPLLINGGGPTKELQFLWFSRTTGAVNEMMVLFGYKRAYLDQQYGLSAAAYLVVVLILLVYALAWYYLIYKRTSPGGT
ncbi:ABC transporter permease subunit [Infirmifilum lucidum]|uniref:ABC transporter permease subunit n=1 Tax=Infirmifilum lucidum TaxID=2776706 RepID=A0A7L9FJC3_9CREN|nr:ABC transporter permease subunit [Infirmifilum lucidum]QOJ79123.1 ABC transporter permease subunit [Infirmifilum lucidum]